MLYVFVAMEVSSRRILHVNVTNHPTAEWTIQQFRGILAEDHPYRFVIHDRDAIFSKSVDLALKDCGVRALKTPVRTSASLAPDEREQRLKEEGVTVPGFPSTRSLLALVPSA